MISCIITACREADTLGKAILCMEDACRIANVEYEILVYAPDEETIKEAISYESKDIKIFQDEGKGKPAALNLAFKEAKGDILILSDGDVYVSTYSIRELLKMWNSSKFGAISGRPESISSIHTKLGYWSHLLTDMADITRRKRSFVCSGYLYALKRGIVKQIPEDCLVDDAYISYKVVEAGYELGYCPTAQVFVKYPDNFKDWMAQKKRSTGGYVQLGKDYKLHPIKEMRSIKQEIKGVKEVLGYAKNFREFVWTLSLIIARLWLWLNIFWERKVMRKEFSKTWTRVGSTK